jgi:hypothetical protein
VNASARRCSRPPARRYLEVRGVVKAIEPDQDGVFFDRLADQYGLRLDDLPDRAQRVVLVIEPTGCSCQ